MKNILLGTFDEELSEIIYKSLKKDFTITTFGLPGSKKISNHHLENDINHDKSINNLFDNKIDAIVITSYKTKKYEENFNLDFHTRRMYNLFIAANSNGVDRVINLSTLKFYKDFEENLTVTENWNTVPDVSDNNLFCAHMTEYVLKEFARDNMFKAINLRLGWPIIPKKKNDYSSVLYIEDLVRILSSSLNLHVSEYWNNLHVQSDCDNQRFITNNLKTFLEKKD